MSNVNFSVGLFMVISLRIGIAVLVKPHKTHLLSPAQTQLESNQYLLYVA